MRRHARRRQILRPRARRQIQPLSGLGPAGRTQGIGRRDPAGNSRKLLFCPGVSPRLHERDRTAHRRDEMAGRVPELHQYGLRLPLGGHRAQELVPGLVLLIHTEKRMGMTTLTRRTVLRTAALATTVLTTPFVRSAAAATVVPKGK